MKICQLTSLLSKQDSTATGLDKSEKKKKTKEISKKVNITNITETYKAAIKHSHIFQKSHFF